MDDAGLARARMRRQRLWDGGFDGPAAVVRAFGALQAQEYLQAKWGVAQRTADSGGGAATDATVEDALTEGAVLRTHVLRPTWHFVHRDEVRALLAATAPRVHGANAHYYRRTGVDDAVAGRSQEVLRGLLQAGAQRTRAEVAAAFEATGLPSSGVPLAYVLMRAELDAVVVSGARRGRQHTYALFDDRVPAQAEPSVDEALALLVRRYLGVRSPATLKDLTAWASLTAKQARHGLGLLGDAVGRTRVGDLDCYETDPPPGASRDDGRGSPRVDLIQGYDELVMGYSESRVASLSLRDGGGRPDHLHTLLLDGQVFGRWKHTARPRTVVVDVQLARAPSPAENEALDDAVNRFGAFLELPATWTAQAP